MNQFRSIEVIDLDDLLAGGRGPQHKGVGGWLRRNRAGIGLVLAGAEAIALLFHAVDRWLLFFVALAAIVLHRFIGRRLHNYALHQVTWILAFAQAAVAIGALIIALTLVFLSLALVIALLVAFALLLGDRR